MTVIRSKQTEMYTSYWTLNNLQEKSFNLILH